MRSYSDPAPAVDTRRGLWRLAAACVAASALLVTACGGATAEAPATPTAARATVAPATVAPAASPSPATSATASARPINPAAPVLTVEASQSGDSLIFKADQIAVAAGDLTINFKNVDTKMNHEMFIYPVQNVTKLMGLKRTGQSATETEFLKDLAGMTGSIAPGASKQIAVTLAPGFYEMACYARIKNADGTTAAVHFDKGQTLTLAAFGAGGPAASIATPSKSLAIQMKDGANDSWVFLPDHLIATAGSVTFSVTNGMKVEHDFAVYPIGDVSKQIADGLKAGEDIDLDAPAQLVFEDLGAGKTDSKTITLTPGTYVMACFMVSKNADGSTFVHRDMGQRITFWVK